jgi:hypothetical protein
MSILKDLPTRRGNVTSKDTRISDGCVCVKENKKKHIHTRRPLSGGAGHKGLEIKITILLDLVRYMSG